MTTPDFETWWDSKDGWQPLDGARPIAQRAWQESRRQALAEAIEVVDQIAREYQHQHDTQGENTADRISTELEKMK